MSKPSKAYLKWKHQKEYPYKVPYVKQKQTPLFMRKKNNKLDWRHLLEHIETKEFHIWKCIRCDYERKIPKTLLL